MKVCIYGAGAMGTTLGAFLTATGVPVDLVTRNLSHTQALKERGATVVFEAEKKEIRVPVISKTVEEMESDYDLIFLMTKQKDNREIATSLKDKLSPSGFVCTTQNGLPEESLIEVLGKEKVCGCVCTWGANFLADGKTAMTSKISSMRMEFTSCSNDAKQEEILYALLSKVGEYFNNRNFAVQSKNLEGTRWNKLAINATFSTLSTITGLSFGEIAKKRTSKKIALSMLRECFAVQDAKKVERVDMHGHNLKKLFGGNGFWGKINGRFLLPFAIKEHKRLYSGMLHDLKKGRRTEIDYVAGLVCRYGKETSVPTPQMDKAVEIVHGIENGLYEITEKNLSFFQQG